MGLFDFFKPKEKFVTCVGSQSGRKATISVDTLPGLDLEKASEIYGTLPSIEKLHADPDCWVNPEWDEENIETSKPEKNNYEIMHNSISQVLKLLQRKKNLITPIDLDLDQLHKERLEISDIIKSGSIAFLGNEVKNVLLEIFNDQELKTDEFDNLWNYLKNEQRKLEKLFHPIDKEQKTTNLTNEKFDKEWDQIRVEENKSFYFFEEFEITNTGDILEQIKDFKEKVISYRNIISKHFEEQKLHWEANDGASEEFKKGEEDPEKRMGYLRRDYSWNMIEALESQQESFNKALKKWSITENNSVWKNNDTNELLIESIDPFLIPKIRLQIMAVYDYIAMGYQAGCNLYKKFTEDNTLPWEKSVHDDDKHGWEEPIEDAYYFKG